jgi:hypothetical protein
MRYLKTYSKLFESNEFATSDELNNIEEILLDIKDLDFSVEIHKNVGGENEELESESEIARIYIEQFAVYGFSQEERECEYYPSKEFISTLQHLVSYVNEIGYNIEIESIHNSSVIDRVSSEKSEINDTDLLVFEYKSAPISYIKITITYKD